MYGDCRASIVKIVRESRNQADPAPQERRSTASGRRPANARATANMTGIPSKHGSADPGNVPRASLADRFEHTGAEYRSLSFWAWNSRLDGEEVHGQVREMSEAGVGGFFMHAREGLETRYLGPEWMRCVREAVDEAGKLGLQAWVYDEVTATKLARPTHTKSLHGGDLPGTAVRTLLVPVCLA